MTGAPTGAPARVTLLTRRSCQLCAPAREIVRDVCTAAGERWTEVDVDSDPELRTEYGDQVPVVLVDGAEVAALQVDRSTVAGALTRA